MKLNINGKVDFQDISEAAISTPDSANVEVNINGDMSVRNAKHGIFVRATQVKNLRSELPQATDEEIGQAMLAAKEAQGSGVEAQEAAVRSSSIGRYFSEVGPTVVAFVVKTLIEMAG